MKMMKCVVLLIGVMFLFIGCTGSLSTEKENTQLTSESESEKDASISHQIMKDVVFINRVYNERPREPATIGRNEYYSLYEISENEDTLYAFRIYVDHYWYNGSFIPDNTVMEEGESRNDIIKELLQREGFIFIDESVEKMTVAATMDQMNRVFGEMEHLENWYLRAENAVRPDMDEILEQARWSDSLIIDIETWFDNNMETLVPLLGTDAAQITMAVPVIMPDEEIKE